MKRPWTRTRTPKLKRQLGLLRWLMRQGPRWIPSRDIRALYGTSKSSRRLCERDMRQLEAVGVPLEWGLGFWRLGLKNRKQWLSSP